ncbi:MAG: metallophosphoesterase [Clostridia bacterium]|nr:metallophosphoesterase [Clostridia bacterium]
MKFLVFSDSHSNSNNIKKAIDMHKGSCDCIIFLGDGVKDALYIQEMYPQIPFFIVKGNCDFFAGGIEEEKLLYLDNFKILITHGHLYGAKSGYARLAYRARELDADAVFFGHTHTPLDDVFEIADKRIQLFNPGSIGFGGTFGVVNTSGRVLVTNHGKIL